MVPTKCLCSSNARSLVDLQRAASMPITCSTSRTTSEATCYVPYAMVLDFYIYTHIHVAVCDIDHVIDTEVGLDSFSIGRYHHLFKDQCFLMMYSFFVWTVVYTTS